MVEAEVAGNMLCKTAELRRKEGEKKTEKRVGEGGGRGGESAQREGSKAVNTQLEPAVYLCVCV